MFIPADSAKELKIDALRGGEGTTSFHLYCTADSSPKNSRLITEISLQPGCSIGKHEHHNEAELYYIIRGTGLLDDNGATYVVNPGDFEYCNQGNYHAIKNIGDTELLLFAVVITE